MQIKILELMDKGPRTVGRIEATDGVNMVTFGLQLEEGMDEATYLAQAKVEAQKKIDALNTIDINIPLPQPLTVPEVLALRDRLAVDINVVKTL